MTNIISGFVQASRRFGQRPALMIRSQFWTYDRLYNMSAQIADELTERGTGRAGVVGVLAARSVTAYTAIIGTLIGGGTYVALNPEHPPARLSNIIRQSKLDALIVGPEAFSAFAALRRELDSLPRVIFCDCTLEDAGALVNSKDALIYLEGLKTEKSGFRPKSVDPDDLAYIMFTSGTTGVPKGVPVSHVNVKSYVQNIIASYDLNERDRFSQASDLNFDLSVHDLFVCWEVGACLCCVDKRSVMAPNKFIESAGITVWTSVPSVIGFMSKLHLLKPGRFPAIRYSFFCGEPLPKVLAQQWQEATPNGQLVNMFGPTEATVAVTTYVWDSARTPDHCHGGIVPIGHVFPNQKYKIIDDYNKQVCIDTPGELLLAGSQVTSGYLNNQEQTSANYLRLPRSGDLLWYRTGDIVKESEEVGLKYLCRKDNQVQIRGYRVELQAVNGTLLEILGGGQVACVAWPIFDGIAEGVYAFYSSVVDVDELAVLEYCKRILPDYMVPRKLLWVEEMPLNANNKIDTNFLVDILKSKLQ